MVGYRRVGRVGWISSPFLVNPTLLMTSWTPIGPTSQASTSVMFVIKLSMCSRTKLAAIKLTMSYHHSSFVSIKLKINNFETQLFTAFFFYDHHLKIIYYGHSSPIIPSSTTYAPTFVCRGHVAAQVQVVEHLNPSAPRLRCVWAASPCDSGGWEKWFIS